MTAVLDSIPPPKFASWTLARRATLVMTLASIAVAVLRITTGPYLDGLVRIDNVTVLVLLLVSLVGSVVVRYSSKYLSGDAQEQRYVWRLLATLAAVTVVVVANNVLLLAALAA